MAPHNVLIHDLFAESWVYFQLTPDYHDKELKSSAKKEEDNMNEHRYLIQNEVYYRGNEASSGTVEAPLPAETGVVPQPLSAIEAKLGDKTAAGEEREKQLELWMENVKLFIRGIDVTKL